MWMVQGKEETKFQQTLLIYIKVCLAKGFYKCKHPNFDAQSLKPEGKPEIYRNGFVTRYDFYRMSRPKDHVISTKTSKLLPVLFHCLATTLSKMDVDFDKCMFIMYVTVKRAL
jgi:hypothetical protein